ncbi:enoyl-CoA hydratase/isomerase family protein [Pseudonocardia sp. CA-142604]|uniref:enoyl-CoA hydratase/isomerase family protein n=1 Tax=Pseudonocardia sp. CA-142604 TaxID=3240024 RepID=UPI003D8C06E2
MSAPTVSDNRKIRWITLNRPDAANALRVQDLDVIADAVTTELAGIRAVVITGQGERAFSSGMHLDTFRDAGREESKRIIATVGRCIAAVRTCSVPTLAVVNGACVGAAFELVLACDLRIAAPGVRFGLPEVKLGVPSVVDAALLPHFIGLSKARELILTGDMYALEELGVDRLVSRVVPHEALESAARELIERIIAHSPEVLTAQKGLFETWLNCSLRESVDISVNVFADMFDLPSTTENIAAYAAGRSRSAPAR